LEPGIRITNGRLSSKKKLLRQGAYWSDTMLHTKQVRVNSNAGSSGLVAPGRAAYFYLGAGLLYAGLGFPGGKKVIREIGAIIDRPKYIAEVAAMGVGGLLMLSSTSA
jgi:hypothetical protein